MRFALMPMNEGFDQFAAIKLVVAVRVVHLEVVELKLLLGHFAGVNRYVHVLLHVLFFVLHISFQNPFLLLGLPCMLWRLSLMLLLLRNMLLRYLAMLLWLSLELLRWRLSLELLLWCLSLELLLWLSLKLLWLSLKLLWLSLKLLMLRRWRLSLAR